MKLKQKNLIHQINKFDAPIINAILYRNTIIEYTFIANSYYYYNKIIWE